MTKEQATFLCNAIANSSSFVSFQAHNPSLRVFWTTEKPPDNCRMWASLFRELAEALEPAMKRCGVAEPYGHRIGETS